MRKNYVVFGSKSGRGISKTKALFDLLSQAYYIWLCLEVLHGMLNPLKDIYSKI